MAKINGTSLLLYVGTDTSVFAAGGGDAIAASKSHTLSISAESIDCTSKDSLGWKEILSGMRSYTIDTEGLVAFDSAFNYEFFLAALTNRTQLFVKLSTENSADEKFFGTVYVTSIEQNAPLEDVISYTVSLEGTAALQSSTIT